MIRPDGVPSLSLQITPMPLPVRYLLIVALLLLLCCPKTTVIAFSDGGDQEHYHPVDGIIRGSGPLDGEVLIGI